MSQADMIEDKLNLGSVPIRPTCAISGKHYPNRSLQSLGSLRPSLTELILRDHPKLNNESLISAVELDKYRMRYVEDMLLAEHGELTELDREVAKSIAEHDTIAENIEEVYDDHRKLGDRLADNMARFGGSWYFLIGFGLFLAIWIFHKPLPCDSGPSTAGASETGAAVGASAGATSALAAITRNCALTLGDRCAMVCGERLATTLGDRRAMVRGGNALSSGAA